MSNVPRENSVVCEEVSLNAFVWWNVPKDRGNPGKYAGRTEGLITINVIYAGGIANARLPSLSPTRVFADVSFLFLIKKRMTCTYIRSGCKLIQFLCIYRIMQKGSLFEWKTLSRGPEWIAPLCSLPDAMSTDYNRSDSVRRGRRDVPKSVWTEGSSLQTTQVNKNRLPWRMQRYKLSKLVSYHDLLPISMSIRFVLHWT